MTDKASELAALGESRPAATRPAATGPDATGGAR